MELSVIIIDDEADAIEAIENIIDINNKDYKIIGKTTDPVKGLGLILQLKPDVVFLDIEMPGMNGFQLLESIPAIGFEVIFVTAYEHYAIRAIKANALDYVLKPVSIPEILNALEKVKQKKKDSENHSENYKKLLSEINIRNKTRIKIPTVKGVEFIDTSDLVYLEADGSYTTAYFKNSDKLIISKPIKQIEPLLNLNTFFRIHRSYIINTSHIRRLERDSFTIIMNNNTVIPLSRRRYNDFMNFLDQVER